MSFNTAKIINVYYKADRKPYDANDKPISYFGEDFNGANEATEIRFYMPEGVDLGAVECVAEVKRANGDKRFDLLTKITNGSGTYYRLVTNAWYNQYVGKVTIAFKAYFGGVTIVDGVITATSGAIYVSDIFHLQIAYAPSSTEPVPPFDPTDVTTFLNALSAKLNVNNGIFVIASALPNLAGGVYDGQWFLVKNNVDGSIGKLFYINGSVAEEVELGLGQLNFSTTGLKTDALATGELRYNDTTGSLDLGVKDSHTIKLGEILFKRVRNDEASNLKVGQVVYVSGSVGNSGLLLVKKADNVGDATSSKTFGIVATPMNTTSSKDGYIYIYGLVQGVDLTDSDITSDSFVSGDIGKALWLGTSGKITKTLPTADDKHSVFVGYLDAYQGAGSNCSIYVKVQNGYEISELHDVRISGVANKHILRYNSTRQVWENVADLTTAETDIDSLEGRMTTAEADIDSLEGRMDTAEGDIDDIEDGTTVVPKALGDQNGDTINTTYLKVATASSTYIPLSQKGVPNGVAPLGSDNKILSIHLPGGVDDVKEFANLASFPATGEASIIYVALDTNKTYRWGGSEYVVISETLAIGETSSTAFAGNRGVALETSVADIIDGDQALSLKDQVIHNTAVGTIPLTVNGVASTTANLTEFQVDGAKKLEISKDGWLYQNGTRLFSQPVDNSNTFFGASSGNGTSTTGGQNTAFGFSALTALTSGASNVAVGRNAFVGLTTGSNNTALGRSAGASVISGGSNTFIGRDSGSNVSQLTSADNSTAIGNQSYTDKSNQMVFGNASVSEFVFNRNTSGSVLMPQVSSSFSGGNSTFNRGTTSLTNESASALEIKHTTSADMVDGFGARQLFTIRDGANVDNTIARLGSVRSGADNSGRFVFETANSGSFAERMTIMPNGNVGIGTSSPTSRLEVAGATTITGTSTGSNAFTIYKNATSNLAILGSDTNIYGGTGTNFGLYVYGNNALELSTNNNKRLVILGDGKVGIGTTSPGAKLQVSLSTAPTTISKANTYFGVGGTENANNSYRLIGFGYSSVTNNYPAYFGYQEKNNSGETNGDLVFLTRSVTTNTEPSERMRILADGKVGIGTPSPSKKVVISGNGGDNSTLRLENTAFSGAVKHTDLYQTDAGNFLIMNGRTDAGGIQFATANSTTPKMVLTYAGSVGIGTSSPAYPFQVEANTSGDHIVAVRNLNNGNLSNGAFWTLNDLNYSSRIFKLSSGYGPYKNLTANSGGWYNDTNGGDLAFLNDSSTGRITFVAGGANSTGHLVISSAGYVGIGNTSPSAALHAQHNNADTTPAIIANLNNSSATGNIQVWQKAGTAKAIIDNGGYFSGTGIYNLNSSANSVLFLRDNGTEINRNVNDANPALIVNQNNGSSTGNIIVLQKAGSAVASFSNSGIFVGQSRPANDAKTANHTLTFVDEGRVLRINSSSNLTVTIPLNSGTELPVGFEVALIRYGTGAVTISPTSGVTLNSKNSERKISGQYASVALKKISTDEWVLVGSLEA